MRTRTQRYPRAYWLIATLAWAGFAGSPALAGDDRPVILFIGTSLTAGYGLPSDEAFPALIQRRSDEAGFSYRVVNGGVSGDTSAGGLRRIGWLLKSPIEILVLELGANDMLRGLDPGMLKTNLQGILDRTRARYPQAKFVIAGMLATPNLGNVYREQFEAVYPEIARTNDAVLIPFLLEGVAAIPSLNQVDGIHPTAEGHRMIAERVWKSLSGLLAKGTSTATRP